MIYKKNFDKWNRAKKEFDRCTTIPSFKEREVWLISIGVNIGSEVDGKGTQFVRPALVLYKKDKGGLIVLPMSRSNKRTRSDYYAIREDSFVVFGQIRVASGKRMIRKVGKVGPKIFERVQRAFVDYMLRKEK